MRLSSGKRSRRTLMASIMLVAFASRMLIPPGFMPASGRPFLMEICWEGLSADMLAHVEPPHADSVGMQSMGMDPMPAHSASHRGPLQATHHHSGSPSQSEHCVFGTACGAGPIPHLPLPSDFSSASAASRGRLRVDRGRRPPRSSPTAPSTPGSAELTSIGWARASRNLECAPRMACARPCVCRASPRRRARGVFT